MNKVTDGWGRRSVTSALRSSMRSFQLHTTIQASPAACFELSLSVDAHTESMRGSAERAVAGVTKGRLGLGDTVTWKATHFGIPFRMTSVVTACDHPYRFVDEQLHGPFRSWWHEHTFTQIGTGETRMTDTVRFLAPFGPLGAAGAVLVLDRYLSNLLNVRNQWLKATLESQ